MTLNSSTDVKTKRRCHDVTLSSVHLTRNHVRLLAFFVIFSISIQDRDLGRVSTPEMGLTFLVDVLSAEIWGAQGSKKTVMER